MRSFSAKDLPYSLETLERELKPFYIGSTPEERQKMLQLLGLKEMKDLYQHLPHHLLFDKPLSIDAPMEYFSLLKHLWSLSEKNTSCTSFLGDGLFHFSTADIVPLVSQIRGLVTAYTPYQPERSQGTLQSLWPYICGLRALTGFEAVNTSLYDRSTCLYEAIMTAKRNKRPGAKIVICESLFPGDEEVLETHLLGTDFTLHRFDQQKNGLSHQQDIETFCRRFQQDIVAMIIPHYNTFGLLTPVHFYTDVATELQIPSIAVIDPYLLTSEALCPPSLWGSQKQGTDIFVGEGQHLAIGALFGGPGLGLFGVRQQANKTSYLRHTPGRFIGKALDQAGRLCKTLVLSTREQHIRREKATSNICSNQSFVATLAGAAMLNRGAEGLSQMMKTARARALQFAHLLKSLNAIELAFPESPFMHELVVRFSHQSSQKISFQQWGLDITERVSPQIKSLFPKETAWIKISFSDLHSEQDVEKLFSFWQSLDKSLTQPGITKEHSQKALTIPQDLLRSTPFHFPRFTTEALKKYYEQLGQQNISPDEHIYPLGSCTMKYNPYLNEYATSFPGWNQHPQAPAEQVQGNLELLFQIQEMFQKITGLKAVTTQPCAGAQGELVGLKMFQAYHRDRGEGALRDIVLIPSSAHGTNPASVTAAGISTEEHPIRGVVEIQATPQGHIDMTHLKSLIELYGKRIIGIMITNPNTSGLFEEHFHEAANMIHQIGGLVYMDGANMNAIAGHVDLSRLGVDAVHNNLHKTWTIPHGGGGPGDGIVAVSERLEDYLPGLVVHYDTEQGMYTASKAKKSIGSFHRHWGNYAHKIRCYAYLKALGAEGVSLMSATSVLCAQYLYHHLKDLFPMLPYEASNVPRMHEFILTLSPQEFQLIEAVGLPKGQVMARLGKLFLDFGIHTPTVAFPEVYGLMIEPTESYSQKELDRFIEVMKAIKKLIHQSPQVLLTAPHFTPVDKIDEVTANKQLILSEEFTHLPEVYHNRYSPEDLKSLSVQAITEHILQAHLKRSSLVE